MSASPAACEDKGSRRTVNPILKQLNDRLVATENQNKRLKDLLIYHLDLIQQQNELITEKDKLYQLLRQENDFIKTKLHEHEEFLLPLPSPPLRSAMVPPQKPDVATTTVKTEPIEVKKEPTFDNFDDLLLPENNSNLFLCDNELDKSEEFNKNNFDTLNTITAADSDNKRSATNDIDISSTSETKSKYTNMQYEKLKSVDNKRSLNKKEAIKTEPLCAVTSTGGNSVMQKTSKNKKKLVIGEGNLDCISNNLPNLLVNTPESSKDLEGYDYFGINKKNEAVYSSIKTSKSLATYTSTSVTSAVSKRPTFGSLSDRFQLIDTTPTGADPYQLGEADLRDQAPIPKLMLQKTSYGRIKVLGQPARRIYDPDLPDHKSSKTQSHYLPSNKNNTDAKDKDYIKTETKIDWCITTPKVATSPDSCKNSGFPFLMSEVSFCDSLDNVASNVSLECNETQDECTSDFSINVEDLNSATVSSISQKAVIESKETEYAVGLPSFCSLDNPTNSMQEPQMPTFPKRNKRCKRKKHCTTLRKARKIAKGTKAPSRRRLKRKAKVNSKKISAPAMTTKKEYHTYVGDPDLTWYFGLDTDIKTDDLDRDTDQKSTTVEVPKWREIIYTDINTAEGTENMDDKTFEKRHQKYEAEERRQLRWHMRRVREQRRLEKLKQRQLDTWSTSPTVTVPPMYSVWPRPQTDIQFIEITDTLPVTAFGEPIPDIKEEEFSLPWVRTSDELKRSKRSKNKRTVSHKYLQ